MYNMETICVKMEDRVAKNMDSSIKEHNYSTRTDFIREAVRDKLKELEKENTLQQLKKFLGAAKTKVNNKRHEEIRQEVTKEYAKKLGVKLD